MKHSITIGIAALVMGASASGLAFSQVAPPMSGNAAPGPNATPSAASGGGMATNDASFALGSRRSNDSEIADARYVLRFSKNAAVRDYATQMIADHSTANVSLASAARKDNVPVPVPRRGPAADPSIQGVAEPQLDAAYMREQATSHAASLALVNTEATSGTQAELKAYAAQQVPIVQAHLNRAQAYVATGGASGASGAGGSMSDGSNAGTNTNAGTGAAPQSVPNATASHTP